MARHEDRRKAIELRIEGKSYSEIKSELGLSKSTLSDWLKKYPLSEKQLVRIKEKKPQQIERFRKTMASKKIAQLQQAYDQAITDWIPLSERELMLAGIFLYWGEGTKVGNGYVCISNSNPKIISFAFNWFTQALNVPKNKFKILVHLYSDMDIHKEMQYWQELLSLPISNFRKPYIKKSQRSGLTYKSFGHGTCNLIISSVELKEKIIQSINAISDHYSKVV